MTGMLEKERVIAILSDAFKPLKCVISARDRNKGLQGLIEMPQQRSLRSTIESASFLQEPHQLAAFLAHWRGQVSRQGVRLGKWTMPEK